MLLLVTALPACIIPLGPDFQDPPAEENLPPQILDPSPAFLSQVNKSNFQVTVTDPNATDVLHIRWFSDYLSNVPDSTRRLGAAVSTIPPSRDGKQQRTTVAISPTCSADRIAPGISLHTIVVMVADHDFADSPDLTLLDDGSHAVTAGWLLDLDCPPL